MCRRTTDRQYRYLYYKHRRAINHYYGKLGAVRRGSETKIIMLYIILYVRIITIRIHEIRYNNICYRRAKRFFFGAYNIIIVCVCFTARTTAIGTSCHSNNGDSVDRNCCTCDNVSKCENGVYNIILCIIIILARSRRQGF